MTELKPCPFCGCPITGKQPYWDDFESDDVYWVIKCELCSAMMYSDIGAKDVKARWNRRAGE